MDVKKKARVAIVISDKLDFKINTVTRDEEEHYITVKGTIQEEDLTSINMPPNWKYTNIYTN